MLSRYELFKEKMINGSAVKLAAIEEVEKTIEQIIRQLLQAGLNEKETLELILDIVKRKLEESTQKQKLCEAIGDANSYTTAGKLEIMNLGQYQRK